MNSRAKGARGEREVVDLYKAAGFFARRTGQMQAQPGALEDDVELVVPGLDIAAEVKRCERWDWGWLDQTVTGARPGQLPLLHFRRSHMPWWVALPADHWLTICGAGRPTSGHILGGTG